MENKQLIKKYALSLYQVGEKKNALDEIQKGIHVVNSLYKSSLKSWGVQSLSPIIINRRLESHRSTLGGFLELLVK
mgnify:CR=1 FL=1